MGIDPGHTTTHSRFANWLNRPFSIAPLVVFRVIFGGIMLASVIRFASLGWIKSLYIDPQLHFSYFGFEWVQALPATGMYAVFAVMALSALGIMLGAFYRWSAVLFFLTFTYVELIDKTTYLNHYYFISLVALLMIFLPAGRAYSLDVLRNPSLRLEKVPFWNVGVIRMQLGLVYVFAGIAKLHPDWLLHAQPLTIWLPPHSDMPFIGPLFEWKATAYFFSWAGALYDLTIPFWLLCRPSRPWAYLAVIGFHIMTWLLFPIGMFPFIMIGSTLVFFPATFHQRILSRLDRFFQSRPEHSRPVRTSVFVRGALVVFFAVQLALPFRYALYPGNLFWNEEGYRFSWRVMLMEKAGYAIFKITDPATGRTGEVINSDYLTVFQEKMMATQPDMILQFAHWLENEYQRQGIANPEVRVACYVTLNGSGTRLYIDPYRDLTKINESFAHRDWVIPYQHAPAL